MAEVSNSIKLLLYKNLLTPDPNDYAPRVAIEQSLGIEDIINDIIASRTDLSASTIRDVNSRLEEAILKRLSNGYAIRTGLYSVCPKASGVFSKATQPYDPSVHQINAQFTQSAQVREKLRASRVVVNGVAPVSILIDEVMDVKSKAVNGTLTRGHNILVSGNDIKVSGEKEGVGVRFINADNSSTVEIPIDELARNTAKELILLVPSDMEPGNYYLEVSTQLSGSTQLKEVRTFRFEQVLTVS
ncbi:DNA-binding domain-containing protein [Odoribacter lunatus]|uniref:DNA-binding domain-containing protein n=1 Tax=Odoribacter lunatus TaxID=2941335 RepID=UPI00203E5928|nr:DNA-binding domain-containing protein [Odoribacter lunatus]